MNTTIGLPKQRTRAHSVPARILLVDDDELELSLMSDRLAHAGFEVAVAHDGQEALQVLDRQWFPIVLTDWQMPVMNGIQLVETLRERGDDCYFIMLSIRTAEEDFERGYFAGVDDYLSKKSPDAELMARIEAGLSTVALRRSLRQSRAALTVVQSEANRNEASARKQLLARLQGEIGRARRYRRPCSVLMLGVHPIRSPQGDDDAPADAAPCELDDTACADFAESLGGVIRVDVDSVSLYCCDGRQVQFAIVLPETGPAEVATIRSRVRSALSQRLRERLAHPEQYEVTVGAASIDPGLEVVTMTAEQLLDTAENCRRCMASNGARRLAAVQTSVMCKAAIPCRYGYAVADHCLELDHRYADVRLVRESQAAANDK